MRTDHMRMEIWSVQATVPSLYGGKIARIEELGVDVSKLYQVKGKCLNSGRDNHVAKDCTANLSANPVAQKARDIGKAYKC